MNEQRYLLFATLPRMTWCDREFLNREFVVYAEREDGRELGESMIDSNKFGRLRYEPDGKKVLEPPDEHDRVYTADALAQLFTDDEARHLEATFAVDGATTRREVFSVPACEATAPVDACAYSWWQCAMSDVTNHGLPFVVKMSSWFARDEVFPMPITAATAVRFEMTMVNPWPFAEEETDLLTGEPFKLSERSGSISVSLQGEDRHVGHIDPRHLALKGWGKAYVTERLRRRAKNVRILADNLDALANCAESHPDELPTQEDFKLEATYRDALIGLDIEPDNDDLPSVDDIPF